MSSEKHFIIYLTEAAERIHGLDPAFFFASPKEDQESFIHTYVQHRELDARNWFPFIRLDGLLVNTSRLHFGNGGPANRSIIKKAIYDDGYRPLISDNAIAGMFRIPLQTTSREMWGDDPDVSECGYFTERGHKFQCLKCLGCGLAGAMNPDTGENAVHKVNAVTGVSADGEIIDEYRNSLEPRTGTIPKWDFVAPDKKTNEKLATFWQSEYVAPGAHFPVTVIFRDVAAVELGLALTAFDVSWKNIGLGSHKNGRLQGWNEDPGSFTMHVWMDSWLRDEEVYRGAELTHIIDLAKRSAYEARQKKLLTKYNLDTSRLRGVKTGKERAEKGSG
jgi:hypothetical protein